MSKTAICLLTLTGICALLIVMPATAGIWATLAKAGLIIFSALSFLALLAGRRIKFDPVLR